MRNTTLSNAGRAVALSLALANALPACREAEIRPGQSCQDPRYANNHPRAQAIRDVMQKYVRLGLPGMSVYVEDSAGRTFAAGAGLADLQRGVPFNVCTPSKAASITKLQVATLAHRLAEQGRLDLDAPVERYLGTDLLAKVQNARGKTLRQLLNHTTGIFDLITSSSFYLAVLNQPNKRWQPEELLRFTHGQDGVALGQPYPASYSNTNTLLLMMCIEKATGQDHVALLREQIWGPLGMSRTYMQGREDIPATAAHGYYDLYNNGTVADVSQLITGSGNGYGGMYTTTTDLRQFMGALFAERTLVSATSLERMTTVLQEDTNFFVGEGTVQKRFGRRRTPGIGHTGRDLGYVANCFYYPSQKAYIIFFVNYGTNGESRLKPVFFDFEEELARVVLD